MEDFAALAAEAYIVGDTAVIVVLHEGTLDTALVTLSSALADHASAAASRYS